MNAENWKKHIETLSGLVRPSLGGARAEWTQFLEAHCQGCKDCMKRKKTRLASIQAKAKRSILRELSGTSASCARRDMGI